MRIRSVVVFLAFAALVGQAQVARTPQSVADELLAADRAFSAAAVMADVVTALTGMFTPDVIMPGAPGRLYRGLDAVRTTLGSAPDATARPQWTPVRAGVSADGLHGFTFGFMTSTRPDGTTVPLKYMSYWIKGASGWRVAGYKRARRPEGVPTQGAMSALLPTSIAPARNDDAWLASLRTSLSRAEQAFSDEAQRVGLGPAFAKWGAATAVNMGGPSSAVFLVGPEAIAQNVAAGAPGSRSPVVWSTDTALVASSGDLGISFGFIRPVETAVGGEPGVPFFTIWSRPGATGEWRYIAE
jgi:hypothetical protein